MPNMNSFFGPRRRVLKAAVVNKVSLFPLVSEKPAETLLSQTGLLLVTSTGGWKKAPGPPTAARKVSAEMRLVSAARLDTARMARIIPTTMRFFMMLSRQRIEFKPRNLLEQKAWQHPAPETK